MNKDYTLCFYRSDAKIGCNKVDLEPEKAKTKMTINRGVQTITATCHNYHIRLWVVIESRNILSE